MNLGTLFGLIVCNVIWSAHPTMGKFLLQGFPPQQSAWLRYMSALLSYSAAIVLMRVALRGHHRKDTNPLAASPIRALLSRPFMLPRGISEGVLLAVLGFSAFCFSPSLQMSGLAASQAIDNSLIIAMEPLMTVFLAYLFLGEAFTRVHAIAFFIALLGFTLLTGLTPSRLALGWDAHLLGNFLMLVSLLGEAAYSTLGRKLLETHPPGAVFGSSLVMGVAALTGLTYVSGGLPSVTSVVHMPWRSLLGLLWLGPFGTALSYLFWMTALTRASVASMALTLFIQPLLGPVWGVIFLGERMTRVQIVGSLLILAAVFGQTWFETKGRRAAI